MAESISVISLSNEVVISKPTLTLSQPVVINDRPRSEFTFVADFKTASLLCESFGYRLESLNKVLGSLLPAENRHSGQMRVESGKWTLEYGNYFFIKNVICTK